MKLRYSSLKAVLLGVALLLLSAKGAQEIVINDSFSFIVNLPTWLVAFKAVVDPIASVLVAGFVILAVLAKKQFVYPPALTGYVVVLAYYFLRSAWLGSSIQLNLLGLAILLAFSIAISLDFGTNRVRGDASAGWMNPLIYFSHGYVIATFAILATGYGYAQVGSRFLGMTYHPNAEGAFAAICAGLFLARVVRPGVGGRQRLIDSIFLALSLLLVAASGSRTATLMVLVACVSLVPARYAFVAVIPTLIAFFFLPEIGDSGAGASVGGAVSRMFTATTGNRDGVWGRLLFDFYAHPFLGVGDTSGVSGSGFLTAFAGDGIIGGLIFFSVFTVAIRKSIGLIIGFRRGRGWSCRLVAAVLMLQILVAAVFEGALFDKFSPFPLLIIMFLVAIWAREPPREMMDERRVP